MPEPLVALDARLLSQRSTGDTAYWRGLVKGLSQIEPGLRFLLCSNAPRPDWIPEKECFSWAEVQGKGRLWSLTAFPREAERHGAAVVHTQYNLSPLVGAKGVTTIHDVSFFIGPEWFALKDRALLRSGIPSSIKRAARVIAVSETCKAEIERYIPAAKGKVRVTYNALGDNISPLSMADAEKVVRDRLEIAGPYLLTVGTRWPRKNMALAVEAAALAGQTLVVAGKAGWGEERTSRNVCYTGYVSDQELTALYQCASLYLAPSKHEGFGIPLLEAWACGCPVVCSNGGALPEIAGDAAMVMESWAAQDWADAIGGLLADSSKLGRLRQRGSERLTKFSWKETARKTVDVYREVIGR
jgi:glycosyltransferase involved in cell wall biosynthesis